MKSSEPPSLEQINQKFQQGQRYFESGRYREAIQYFSQANALAESSSKLAGEIGLWLVTAYDAAGHRQEGISLCRRLAQSPFIDVRRQAKRLLVILEAPKLSIHDDWVTTIPPLDSVNAPGQIQGGVRRPAAWSNQAPKPAINDQEVDLSQVTTSDRGLAIMAGILVLVLSLGLAWVA